MAAKDILVLCVQALLIQSALSQCLDGPFLAGLSVPYSWDWAYNGRNIGPYSWGYDGIYDWPSRSLALPNPGIEITSTSGGSLVVTSSSPIPPIGISIISDNIYEGILATVGEVPFVGTISAEGTLPTGGAGAINYGCGTGVTAMLSNLAPGFSPAYAPGLLGSAIGVGGCGCGYL